jgi:hypothetical protein
VCGFRHFVIQGGLVPSRLARVAGDRPALLEILETRLCLSGDFAYAYQVGAAPKRHATNNDFAHAVFVDRNGNTYLAGGFSGTVDFNPSRRRTFTLTSTGKLDAFVVKYAPDGSFVWARQAGGFEDDQATAVAVDRKGNVFVAGGFGDSADFRPGKRFAILDSTGGVDAFVWKLDADGNLAGAVHAGGPANDAVNAIALDGDGNVAISGFFNQSAFFDTQTLESAGGQDAFVAKLSNTLGLTFVKRVGGTGTDTGAGIAFDATGNLFQAGNFAGSVDFDPGAGSDVVASKGGQDAFLLELTPTGTYASVSPFGGTGNDFADAVILDRFNNALLTGTFNGTADFDPGGGVSNLSSAGSDDIFVAKLNSAGTLAWARRAGGANADAARAITTDKAGNVYTTGQFNGPVDFDPGAGTFNLAGTNAVANGYVWKLNASGNLTYAKMLKTTTGFCEGRGIAINAAGDLFVAGMFSGSVDFDPGPGAAAAATGRDTSYDAFLEKLLA